MDKKQARLQSKESILTLDSHTKERAQDGVLSEISDFFQAKDLSFARIGLYRSDPWEISLDGLVEAFPNWKFFYPKVLSNTEIGFFFPESWEVGAFGIQEPVGSQQISPRDLDWILIPGLGFGKLGHRLGRGKGFYDRVLEGYPIDRILGVCYSVCQDLDFSWENHDIRVGFLFTEKSGISFLD